MLLFQHVQQLIDQGGVVLWAIFATCLLLWFLILERFWFLRVTFPKRLKQVAAHWNDSSPDESNEKITTHAWCEKSFRKATLSECKLQLTQNLGLIKTLIVLCPLLGLLGTVTGMVNVFEVIAVVGTSDAQAMAQGVYRATIPTMSGLVVALSGLYFSARLQHKAAELGDKATDHLMQL